MLRLGFACAASAAFLMGCATAPTACIPAPAPAAAVAAPAPVSTDTASAPATAPAPAQALVPDPTMYDKPLAAAIVGSWIVPRESSDFRHEPVREVYRDDGTYTLYYYSDKACGKVVGQVDADWRIERTNLVATVTRVSGGMYGRVGDVSTDQIVSMGKNTMSLRSTRESFFSFGDNKEFTRVRSDGCYDGPGGD